MKWILFSFIGLTAFSNIDVSSSGEAPDKYPSEASGDKLVLFAHRGIMNYFPENSTSSLNQARKLNFNAVEIDIRKSKDDQFVLVHDDSLGRLTGRDAMVTDLTVAQLKKEKLLFKGKETTDVILTLDEVLETYEGDFIFYLDNKIKTLKAAEDLAQVIERHDAYTSVVVACTDFFFIAYLELKHPEINTVLEGFTPGKELFYKLLPGKLKPDFIASFASDIDADHVQWLKKNNLLNKRIAYYADSSNYENLIANGIQKLVIDYDSTMADFMHAQGTKHALKKP